VIILPDTNVLISATITRGRSSELLDHCLLRHTVVTSEYILEELREKLITKFYFSAREAAAVRRTLLEQMVVITPDPLPSPICRDPDDDNILAAAVAGNCDCIVTGDKDLLVLREYQGIPILKPSAFMEWESRLE